MTVGHILFVSPDNDGIVHDKVYSYGDAGATEIKLLAKAIYRLITSLDFIHNQEINLTADPKRSVKNVKEFVAKLIELDAK